MTVRDDPEPGAPRVGTRYVAQSPHPLLRPKDAASIILIDRSDSLPKFLVGKRGKAHAFMPNFYVFPGGRRDFADSRIPVARPFRDSVMAKLMVGAGAAMTPARARALGVAAIRETQEEAGLKIGAAGAVGRHPDWQAFAQDGLAPDLSALRYITRAITPPRQSRRFDTRFFACFLDEIGAQPDAVRDSDELHDLTWIGFDDIATFSLPQITRSVLGELKSELAFDPDLAYGRTVPFYYVKRGVFVREVL